MSTSRVTDSILPQRTGTVVHVIGRRYAVQTINGKFLCHLAGKVGYKTLHRTPIVIGDQVEFFEEETGELGVITHVLPRRNCLVRQGPRNKHVGQLLSANIDQALLLMLPQITLPTLRFIDDFLILATSLDVPAQIVFNKQDDWTAEQYQIYERLQSLYMPLGYPCHSISALTGAGLPTFCTVLKQRISLLVGPSGVGKSTLVNALVPGAKRRVGKVGKESRGRHTTTDPIMLAIAGDTLVIDTPGVQTLWPYGLVRSCLQDGFPELKKMSTDCRFQDCHHRHEPGCAVRKAVDQGHIATSRYQHYIAWYQRLTE